MLENKHILLEGWFWTKSPSSNESTFCELSSSVQCNFWWFHPFSPLILLYSCTDENTTPSHAFITQDDDGILSPIIEESFDVGERLLYTNEGHTSMVTVRSIISSAEAANKFVIEFPNKRYITTIADCLREPSQPDIVSIPVNPEDFLEKSTKLSENDCKALANLTILSHEQQELISYHERLYHLPFTVLMRMANIGLIPRRLQKMRNNIPLCPSCNCWEAHCRPWRFKRTKDGILRGIRKATDTKPGSTVFIDQLISAQPGLIPRTSGNLTRAQIGQPPFSLIISATWSMYI